MNDISNKPLPHPKYNDLSPLATSCSTGCVFGSHPKAVHPEVDPTINREHFRPPPPGVLPSPLSSISPAIEYGMSVADLIARYGNSSSTAWLDRERYKIWRPSQPIPESEFTPVQGYIQKSPFIFAWGNPLISSPTALEKTARAFIAFAEASHHHIVWSCVSSDLETVLAGGALGWVTVSCIYENIVDPAHVIELASQDTKSLVGPSGHLAKNLHIAEMEQVEICQVEKGEWNHKDREAVELGIMEWQSHNHGMRLESMTFSPWTDEMHRRYWLARRQNKIIGVAILSQTSPTSWQIVKCLTFRYASHGTSEKLVYTALKDLYEQEAHGYSALSLPVSLKAGLPEAHMPSDDRTKNRLSITFGIAASDHLEPGHNISGWKIAVLSKTYFAVSGLASLIKTGEYAKEFETRREPMYVCYPANGFGFIAIGALIMALRQ